MAFYEVDFMSACNPKQIKIRRTDVRTIFTEQWIKVLDFFFFFGSTRPPIQTSPHGIYLINMDGSFAV